MRHTKAVKTSRVRRGTRARAAFKTFFRMLGIAKSFVVPAEPEPRRSMAGAGGGFEASERGALVLGDERWEGARGFEGCAHVETFGVRRREFLGLGWGLGWAGGDLEEEREGVVVDEAGEGGVRETDSARGGGEVGACSGGTAVGGAKGGGVGSGGEEEDIADPGDTTGKIG